MILFNRMTEFHIYQKLKCFIREPMCQISSRLFVGFDKVVCCSKAMPYRSSFSDEEHLIEPKRFSWHFDRFFLSLSIYFIIKYTNLLRNVKWNVKWNVNKFRNVKRGKSERGYYFRPNRSLNKFLNTQISK